VCVCVCVCVRQRWRERGERERDGILSDLRLHPLLLGWVQTERLPLSWPSVAEGSAASLGHVASQFLPATASQTQFQGSLYARLQTGEDPACIIRELSAGVPGVPGIPGAGQMAVEAPWFPTGHNPLGTGPFWSLS
jgi:hypothetical protein